MRYDTHDTSADGSVSIRLVRPDGGWHRIAIEPGGTLPDGLPETVVAAIRAAWTPKVLAAHARAVEQARAELAATEPPPADQVRAEAGRRITAQWPLWKQNNVLMAGDAAEIAAMRAAINAIREASNRLEAMDPVPDDFADDKHWPGANLDKELAE
jgi:hypothetical protein